MRIVVLDGYAANPGDLSWQRFEEFGEVTVFPRSTKQEAMQRAKEAEIVFTNKVVFDAELFDALSKLKLLCILATGYNTIDLQPAREHGVTVCNVPAYSTDSVAQMTFAHILNITSQVGYYAAENRKGRWTRNADFCYWDSPLIELSGKTLGIVGLGNIGRKIAQIAINFGMNVLALTSKSADELPSGIVKAEKEEFLGQSDIITLHCPLTDDTREFINGQTIAMMKRGAIIINTARGRVINEHDVAAALTSGYLSAYGADVLSVEPPTADNPLLSLKNAYLTPHVAWASIEARTRLFNVAYDNVRLFLAGTPQNVVS